MHVLVVNVQVAAYEKVMKLKKAYELRCKEVDKIDEEVCVYIIFLYYPSLWQPG